MELIKNQEREARKNPIRFISKTLSKTERRWDTVEKEAYAIFYALKKLKYLLHKHFIKNCYACQKMSQHKNVSLINPFTLATTEPMQRVYMDTIGPINSDPSI